jgi:hypothetical protein
MSLIFSRKREIRPIGKINNQARIIEVSMATVEVNKEDVLVAYADEQYRKLLKEKDRYISLDEYCAKRGIE